MVKINSSHADAVDVIGSYIIDAASRTFYKQNKPTGHYLFLNEATGWWTVRKNILFNLDLIGHWISPDHVLNSFEFDETVTVGHILRRDVN